MTVSLNTGLRADFKPVLIFPFLHVLRQLNSSMSQVLHLKYEDFYKD